MTDPDINPPPVKPAAPAKPGGGPSATSISKFLADAGFKRNNETPTRITGGFKVFEYDWAGGARVGVHWVESLDETSRRMASNGVGDVSKLPENPHAREYAAAYADALAARYSVDLDGTHVYVEALPEPPRPARGRPKKKDVTDLLKAHGIPSRRGGGWVEASGCSVVQEADHVRIQVRPWETGAERRGITQSELDAAVAVVRAALDSAGYPSVRTDTINGAVLKVTGRLKRERQEENA